MRKVILTLFFIKSGYNKPRAQVTKRCFFNFNACFIAWGKGLKVEVASYTKNECIRLCVADNVHHCRIVRLLSSAAHHSLYVGQIIITHKN